MVASSRAPGILVSVAVSASGISIVPDDPGGTLVIDDGPTPGTKTCANVEAVAPEGFVTVIV